MPHEGHCTSHIHSFTGTDPQRVARFVRSSTSQLAGQCGPHLVILRHRHSNWCVLVICVSKPQLPVLAPSCTVEATVRVYQQTVPPATHPCADTHPIKPLHLLWEVSANQALHNRHSCRRIKNKAHCLQAAVAVGCACPPTPTEKKSHRATVRTDTHSSLSLPVPKFP